MSAEAFGETLQFITNVKLEELEKRRQKYSDHLARVLAKASEIDDSDLIARLVVLIDGMKIWPGAWSSNVNFEDVERWLEQAKKDPGFPRSILLEWIDRARAQLEHEQTRFDFAKLFGSILTDWLSSKAQSRTKSQTDADAFEKVNRKETLEQKAQLESLIFEEKHIDVPALEAYLKDLFSSKEAEEALDVMRERMEQFSDSMQKFQMGENDVETAIKSVLRADILSEEKQATLKEFQRNPIVIKELTSVLNMQRDAIQSWHWPKEGVLLEPRRQLNGKTRFYLDTEILTALLLHDLGMRLGVEFRRAFDQLRESQAWKKPASMLTPLEKRRRAVYLPRSNPRITVNVIRQGHRRDHFFMCQLPKTIDVVPDNYDDESSDDDDSCHDPRFNTPVDLKQSLMHIISADVLLNKALYGQATVVRTDLEWFGPSLPHETILTIFRFFGLPERDVQVIKSFLSCPTVFKDDPSGQVRTRKRGVPLSYSLSTVCGEVVLFVMDFVVNQRADGLFLYRIHDDFWFWDKDAEPCERAWDEINKLVSLVGLTFNKEKTGSICTGAEPHQGLPKGDVRWGFLKMDENGRFVIDQAMIDEHVLELHRQLEATTSVFSWIQAYNKYMAFVVRNCGEPAVVYGKAHIDEIITTLARIQRTLFPTGGFSGSLAKTLQDKFGIDTADIPLGFYLWPNAAGGLEVKDSLVDLFLIREGCKETPQDIIENVKKEDEASYQSEKRYWDDTEPSRVRQASTWNPEVAATEPFMTFEEFVKGREDNIQSWANAYQNLLRRPGRVSTTCTPELEASIKLLDSGIKAFGVKDNAGWSGLSPYWKWVIGLHHHEMIKKFGSLAIVDSNAVPVGMVEVFKSSKVRWEQ